MNDLTELEIDDCVEEAAAKAAPKKKTRNAPAVYTEVEKLEHQIRLAEARTQAACKGNSMLLAELHYVLDILAEATGMHKHEVYASVRDRSITLTDKFEE